MKNLINKRVTLIDSIDAYGTIIGQNNDTVDILLDDGFKRTASKYEYTIIDEDERNILREVKPKQKTTNTPKKTTNIKEEEFDLHIDKIPNGTNIPVNQRLSFQLETFRNILYENKKHRGKRLIFISGLGEGKLHKALKEEIDNKYITFCYYIEKNLNSLVVVIK